MSQEAELLLTSYVVDVSLQTLHRVLHCSFADRRCPDVLIEVSASAPAGAATS